MSLGATLLAAVLLAVSCAQIGGPPGGPADTIPPQLVTAAPDSGAVGLAGLDRLQLVFSEKMERKPAESWLYLYPPADYRKTKWSGAREATVILSEPLPPDTVVIVEVGAGLRDAHKVVSKQSWRFPIATGARIPPGEIIGRLVYNERPLAQSGVVELYAVPPDSLEYYQQKPVRRAVTDSAGVYRLPWLPIPGGPYLLRVFNDGNGDLRLADNEGRRLLPDTVRVTAGQVTVDVGLTVVYDPTTPGLLRGHVDSLLMWPGPLYGWPEAIAEDDTGWAPYLETPPPAGLVKISLAEEVVFAEVPPGLNRLIFFVDADGDSAFSKLPAEAGTVDAAGREIDWFYEPHALIDSLLLEPGLEASFSQPHFATQLVPWFAAAGEDSAAGTAESDASETLDTPNAADAPDARNGK